MSVIKQDLEREIQLNYVKIVFTQPMQTKYKNRVEIEKHIRQTMTDNFGLEIKVYCEFVDKK